MAVQKRYRPDKDGTHKYQYLRNKRILYATQTYCAICGKPVNFDLKFPDPMSPTADHIIPISLGGHPSDLGNLQLAHLSCNRRKGENLMNKKEPIRKSNRSLKLSADWTVY
jgi:5-methylcytosine-specific restriction endonuclease McrA